MLRTLPFCACGTKPVSCERQRASGAIKCFLKHFIGVQHESLNCKNTETRICRISNNPAHTSLSFGMVWRASVAFAHHPTALLCAAITVHHLLQHSQPEMTHFRV